MRGKSSVGWSTQGFLAGAVGTSVQGLHVGGLLVEQPVGQPVPWVRSCSGPRGCWLAGPLPERIIHRVVDTRHRNGVRIEGTIVGITQTASAAQIVGAAGGCRGVGKPLGSPLNLATHLGQDAVLAQVLHHHRHVPAALTKPGRLITWNDVNTILATHRLEPPRFLPSADGEMQPALRYTDSATTRRHTVWYRLHPAELHARLAEGASFAVNAVDELHRGQLPAFGAVDLDDDYVAVVTLHAEALAVGIPPPVHT